jgi:CopG family transcriptional regulator, nickel-responsive regulator
MSPLKVLFLSTKVLRFRDYTFNRMNSDSKKHKSLAQRISISLPSHLATALDEMIDERGFQNRSQAVAEMIENSIIKHQEEAGDTIMAGTITLFYDSGKTGLLQQLAKIEREHVNECISSQHVLLEGQYIMEVVLVQGPVERLRALTDRILTCKGVSSGGLTLTSKLIPQLHGR